MAENAIEQIQSPWTPEQVTALNAWQGDSRIHPFTCPADGYGGSVKHSDRRILVATEAGWRCEFSGCEYTQAWAPSFMATEHAPGSERETT